MLKMCSCMSTRPSFAVSSGPSSVWIWGIAELSSPRGGGARLSSRRMVEPCGMGGIERGADGIARYTDRPASLVAMLRATTDRIPEAEAIVELGGPRLTYAELWERSARVAGGLRAEGIAAGD